VAERFCTVWLIALAFLNAVPAAAEEVAAVNYARDVQPILAKYCYACHGPDKAQRQANLRLDRIQQLHEQGSYLIDGNAQTSTVYQRLIASDPDAHMPPLDQPQPTLEEIAVIRKWIEAGANWQPLWSLQPVKQPSLPDVRNKEWPQNAIDHFVLAKLESLDQSPASPADKYQWLRRVTFDLTGLPPTVAEIESFIADKSPTAETKVIDRLLASNAYGEHFAAQWLDLARYADTHGYNFDSHRDMWRYREWVIEALNANMPFDQFSIEQLAGDLLPEADINQITATGFHRNHPINDEEGAFAEEYLHAYMVDRVNTTGAVWLGMTLSCAQCHNHKYDPISQQDYYRLAAYFANVEEKGLDGKNGNAAPVIASPTRQQQQREAALLEQQSQIEATLDQMVESAHSKVAKWEGRHDTKTSPVGVLQKESMALVDFDTSLLERSVLKIDDAANPPPLVVGKSGQGALFDGSRSLRFAVDANDLAEEMTVSFWGFPTSEQAAIWLLDGKHHVRVAMSNGQLTVQFGANHKQALVEDWETHTWYHIAIRMGAEAQVFLNGKRLKLQSVEIQDAVPWEGDSNIWLLGAGKQEGFRGLVDSIRVDDRALTDLETQFLADEDPIAKLRAIPPGQRTPQQHDELTRWMLRSEDEAFRNQEQAAKDLTAKLGFLRSQYPQTMVMREKQTPAATFLRVAGQYDQLGARVEPGLPQQLFEHLPEGTTDRLQLARWIVHPKNPLTPRVIVNRYWQHYFGTGLVETAEDFGTRGSLPSHPELLEFLADEFVRSGWDVKHLQRLIVSSETYRQSSHSANYEADPKNRYLARGPRLRLTGEQLRDQALAASELLVRTLGGPSVKPYQPPGLWEELSRGPRFTAQAYQQGSGEQLYRRSLYTYWKRSSPPPRLAGFDAPSREVCVAQRSRTNTPQQALVLLNDPTFIEASRALAEDLAEEHATAEQSIRMGFQRVLSRPIQQAELELLSQLYEDQLLRFLSRPADAERFLSVGEKPARLKRSRLKLAALAVVCHTLFNLDEAVTKP